MTILSRLAFGWLIAACGGNAAERVDAGYLDADPICRGPVCDCRVIGAADGDTCPPSATHCEIEGHAACDAPGTISGECDCVSGHWQCSTSCPAGCPATQPQQAAACTLAAGTECPYQGTGATRTICTCDGSHFDCK